MKTLRPLDETHPARTHLVAASITVGAVMVLLGAIALGAVYLTSMVSVMLLGVLLIASGLFEIGSALTRRAGEPALIVGLAGVMAVFAGVLLLFRPTIGLASVTLIAGLFFLANGVYRLIGALLNRYANWGWEVAYGVCAIVLGIIVLGTWPRTSTVLLGTLVGLELIFRGAAFLGLGVSVWSARRSEKWAHP